MVIAMAGSVSLEIRVVLGGFSLDITEALQVIGDIEIQLASGQVNLLQSRG